jgi:hypothetical protein
MSGKIVGWALTQRIGPDARKRRADAATTWRRKLVLCALAEHAKEHDGWCNPGQGLLAIKAECSVDTVQRDLDWLEGNGFITRKHRGGRGKGRQSDEYWLNVERVGDLTARLAEYRELNRTMQRFSHEEELNRKPGGAKPLLRAASKTATCSGPNRQSEPSLEPRGERSFAPEETDGAGGAVGDQSDPTEFTVAVGGPPRDDDDNDEDATREGRGAAGSPGAAGATCGDRKGSRAGAANDNGGRRLPFSPDVIRHIEGLGVDLGPLIDRYRTKTAGKRIGDPSAYLLRMGQDEAAKTAGVDIDTIKRVNGGSREDRAKAWAGATGIGAEPRPEHLASYRRRLKLRGVDPEERLEAWRKSRQGRQPFASAAMAEADLNSFDSTCEFRARTRTADAMH